MSDTTAAFQAARNRLARFVPEVDTIPAISLTVPRRSRPNVAPTGGEAAADGPLQQAARALRAGETTSVTLVEQSLMAMERFGPSTRGVVTALGDAALATARTLDAQAAMGRWSGPMHGIPFTVKDNLHVAGVTTYAGSDAYEKLPTKDQATVALMRLAGGIPVAKVATHEFALGVTTPQARHPKDPERIPGGSSGGGGISIATGMALASIATDTRASIRVPAALCGVVGYKPTYGWLPSDGVVWLSWTMDHIGLLLASVGDTAYVTEALTGRSDLMDTCRVPVAGMRIGVPTASFLGAEPDVERSVRAAIARLAGDGATIVELANPTDEQFELSNAAGLIVSRAEALEYHRSVGTDFSRIWAETRDQFQMAEQLTIHEYLTAQRFRTELAAEMLRVVESQRIDALVMPTTLATAPLVPEAESYFTRLSRNAIPWSFLGWPVVSVPCGEDGRGLPIGLQVVATPDDDATVFRVARAVEAA